MLYATISLLFILLFMFGAYDSIKPHNFPPGPKWLPVVGCFFKFRQLKLKHRFAYLALQELTKTYGPILGLKLGNQKIVVISTYKLVKKVLLQEEFNGRPDGFFFRARAFGKRNGILFTDGLAWAQCRRFTMRHLKNFGFGQSPMEQQLIVESNKLVDYFRRASAKGPVQMHRIFDIAVLNSLWFMFAGHTFDYEDAKVIEILKTVHDAFRIMDTMGGMVSYMPFLRFIIPESCGYNTLMSILQKLWNFLDEEIRIHEKRLSGNQPRDLIDAFLLEISSENAKKQRNSIFHRENLLVLCLDLFLAGSKTTTDTLSITFLYLSLHPKWIVILQKELDNVVGRSRPPTLRDYPLLPKMESFLTEVQRYSILAPLGVPHRTTKDVTLNGYNIPKNTTILLDFRSVLHDEICWSQPELFQPDRFLDNEDQFYSNKANIPFGIGKRRCPGEKLARTSMFLFFAHIVHYFNFEFLPQHSAPDPDGYDGFTISPKSYFLKFTARPSNT